MRKPAVDADEMATRKNIPVMTVKVAAMVQTITKQRWYLRNKRLIFISSNLELPMPLLQGSLAGQRILSIKPEFSDLIENSCNNSCFENLRPYIA